MGKIAPISAKYIINAKIKVKGVVEKPDVIGAVFGQTEGLLGTDLELRELQKSGRIGRIDAELTTSQGKTSGTIVIPSSLAKTETALIAAALETIERIGPCDAELSIEKIEDVRVSKRDYLMQRAQDLLKTMIEQQMPDSHEITEKIQTSVKEGKMIKFGPEKLTAGEEILKSDEIIVVEGRADVINLLHSDIRNAISMDGTSVPDTIAELCKKKTVTVFVDGDRGGDLIIKELLQRTKIDFIAKAPEGKEVEELTQKEIIKALRLKIPIDKYEQKPARSRQTRKPVQRKTSQRKPFRRSSEDRRPRAPKKTSEFNTTFKKMLEELLGTRGAYILNKELQILGKVPVKELTTTLKDLEGVFAVIVDGMLTKQIINEAEKVGITYLVGSRKEGISRKVKILVSNDLK